MRTYLYNLWDTLRTSYWFIPSLFALGTLVLFWSTLTLQPVLIDGVGFMPGWIETKAGTARAILSAVAGAIVAVTGTVFSITIVTLSLASQQFGPRLLRSFMHDLPTQITLGIFLATGFYSLLALGAVESPAADGAAFHVSVFITFVLTVISMLTLVFFIHNVAVLIQAPHVVAGVAKDLDESIERLFPDKVTETDEAEHEQAVPAIPEFSGDCVTARSKSEGYIQAIDYASLVELAQDEDMIFKFLCRPGDFLANNQPVVEVWSMERDLKARGRYAMDRLENKINDALILGERRTPRQDVECALEELVEVAVRSLSPGVNDPFTAINCIDRLGAAMSRLALRKFPGPIRFDKKDRMRLIVRHVTFPGILDCAFHQIRQYGESSVAVTVRLLEAIISVARDVRRPADIDAIRRHGEMVARNAERWREQNDIADVALRFEELTVELGTRTQRMKSAE